MSSTSREYHQVAENTRRLALTAGLTKTEQALFVCLASKAEALVSRTELLAVLKGNAPHTIDSHIMAIRRKLSKHGVAATINTVVGSGFILSVRGRDA